LLPDAHAGARYLANVRVTLRKRWRSSRSESISLGAPFELQWRRISGKPWDWKLIRVSNPELQLPSEFE